MTLTEAATTLMAAETRSTVAVRCNMNGGEHTSAYEKNEDGEANEDEEDDEETEQRSEQGAKRLNNVDEQSERDQREKTATILFEQGKGNDEPCCGESTMKREDGNRVVAPAEKR
ncbi:hypothetical protein PIB30_008431 [Stylosanthes scabra]|uniref:Uncharacterized protein n=1 Tax=Stylosanthes scabra TaxID=79078 RepID=A0ABU6W4U5_9FABA|nr:hypothetical protein [Stylosanthes scabra]